MIYYKEKLVKEIYYKGVQIPLIAFSSKEVFTKYIGMIDAGAVAIWDWSDGVENALETVVDDKANKVGKNLLPLNNWESGSASLATGELTNDINRVRTITYIEVTGGSYYVISGNPLVLDRVLFYDSAFNYISYAKNISAFSAFSTPTNAKFVKVVSGNSANQQIASVWNSLQIQFELGSVATAYEPYKKNTAVLKNFAGTTSSGNVKLPILSPKGEAKTFTNLLGDDGNFEGSNLGSLSRVGAPLISNEAFKFGTKSLKFACEGNSKFIYLDAPGNISDIIYSCAYAYLNAYTSGSFGVRLDDYGMFNNTIYGSTTLLNEWIFVSAIKTATTDGIRVVAGGTGSGTLTGYMDGIHAFNLTQIFGTGKEPTKDQMDVIVQQAIARYGYINERVLLIEWKNFLKADGVNDYAEVMNNGSLDFVGTQDFAFMGVFVTPSVLQNGYLFSKNFDSIATMQFGINIESIGEIRIRLENTSITVVPIGSLVPSNIYILNVIRKNGVLRVKLNNSETYYSLNSLSLSSKPFIRLFVRSNSTTGTAHTAYSNNYHAHLSAYGANVDETKLETEYQKLLTEYGII